jgi:hypothetical protein
MYTSELHNPQQLEDLINLAIGMHGEIAPHIPFIPEVIRNHGFYLFDHPEHRKNINAYVSYTDAHEPVGFLVCHAQNYLMNYNKLAMQELWYVKPDMRGFRAAQQLFQKFESWAFDELDCLQAFAGVVSYKNDYEHISKVSRVIEKLGFKNQGRYFVKEKPNGHTSNTSSR